MTRQQIIAAFSVLALITTAGLLTAGPLTPPVGPVAPSGKTTQEVFDKVAAVESRIAINATNTPGDIDASPSLFKITQPGSYYLTGNITGVGGRHGIEIAASGVTLDLNGFQVVGVTGSLKGIFSTPSSSLKNVTITNGTVRNWGSYGIDLYTWAVTGCRVEGVHASSNGEYGIAGGFASRVTDCTATSNTNGGILTNPNAVVTGCVARENGGVGIDVQIDSVVSSCFADSNGGTGINAGSSSSVVNCVAKRNGSIGIRALQASVVNTEAISNTGAGFDSTDSSVVGCVAHSNGDVGFRLTRCTADQCTAAFNTDHGFTASGSLLTANISNNNGFNGSGSGINITGSGSRIEANNCNESDIGIEVTSPGNFIIRNTCRGNTLNWSIAVNNTYGPIIDRTAPASPPVSGNAAPEAIGSVHPNANFTY